MGADLFHNLEVDFGQSGEESEVSPISAACVAADNEAQAGLQRCRGAALKLLSAFI